MLLNVLLCTRRAPQQRVIQPQRPLVLRLRSPGVRRLYLFDLVPSIKFKRQNQINYPGHIERGAEGHWPPNGEFLAIGVGSHNPRGDVGKVP